MQYVDLYSTRDRYSVESYRVKECVILQNTHICWWIFSLLKKANKNLSYKLCNQKLFPTTTKNWHNGTTGMVAK